MQSQDTNTPSAGQELPSPLSCPWCGSVSVGVTWINRTRCECIECGACGPFSTNAVRAIAAWNRRQPDRNSDPEDAAFGCVKNTIRVQSGTYLDLLDPKPEQFTIGDIAGALSRICRFGGQVPVFYSVAEHLLHCAGIAYADGLRPSVRMAVLMHDAAEAFCGDVVKPLKVMLRDYAAIESRVEDAIALKFEIDFVAHKDAVREIDRAMLIAERRALFSADTVEWTGENDVRIVHVDFPCWTPKEAESRFLAAFEMTKSLITVIERRLNEPGFGRGVK